MRAKRIRKDTLYIYRELEYNDNAENMKSE